MREVVTLKEYYISIHALRVEGDVIYIFIFVFVPSISIHALRVEGDPHNMYAIACTHFISIHALRVEGDHPSAKSISKKFYFYPRPPGGGRPFQLSTGLPQKHFYPRPPGGGRRAPFFALCSICRFLSTPSGWRATRTHKITEHHTVFLSTPSGWRATHSIYQDMLKLRYFYPRPPGGGRQVDALTDEFASAISIHALRVEGDCAAEDVDFAYGGFLSTPSGWRATLPFHVSKDGRNDFYPRPPGGGRQDSPFRKALALYFYPRPPGGGRLSFSSHSSHGVSISIHALRVEGDRFALVKIFVFIISIHALRVEGDSSIFDRLRRRIRNFYPRPPGGGRPSAFHPYTPAV